MDFCEDTLNVFDGKVVEIALLFGLFPMIQWNISFFRDSDGNPN